MKKTLISTLVAAVLGVCGQRQFTKDSNMAFTYRMGAGFPGDVNRTHPASIEPVLIDVTNPPAGYGYPTIIDASSHGVRGFQPADTAVTSIYGVTVRPYPLQQSSGGMSASFGSATPPVTGNMDVLRTGYIMAAVPAGQTPVKGGAVYVWCAASGGGHTQGGFEASASGGNTAALDATKYMFNGGADANGNVEIVVNP